MQILREYKESDILFFDIETARGVNKLEKGSPMEEAWRYKARYQNELVEKVNRGATEAEIDVSIQEFFKDKAALYAPFGRIVAIVVGRINGDALTVKAYADDDEARMLSAFSSDLSMSTAARPGTLFCGFNNRGFDEPYLIKRMIIHGIHLHPLLDTAHLKPWEIRGIDLSALWKGSSFYPDSLNAVAMAMGLPSPKADLNGAEVSDAFYAGRLEDIKKYCAGDVLTTANIYRKFCGKSLVHLAPSM